MGNNTAAYYDVMLMKIMPQPSVDTLYHYNAASNKLEGRFTVKYPSNDKIPGMHIMKSLNISSVMSLSQYK